MVCNGTTIRIAFRDSLNRFKSAILLKIRIAHGTKGPWDLGPKGPWGLGPMGHGPLGPWDQGPMGPWALGPRVHGPMGLVNLNLQDPPPRLYPPSNLLKTKTFPWWRHCAYRGSQLFQLLSLDEEEEEAKVGL